MASIQTQIGIVDRMTAPIQSIMGAVSGMITALENVDAATNKGFDTAAVLAARQAYDLANAELEEINESIRRAAESQEKLNDKIKKGGMDMSGLAGKVMGLAGAYAGVSGIKNMMDLSDSMSQINARLNMINDNHQELNELQGMIFASAQRSRAGFMETADVLSKLAQKTKGVFSSNAETIAFAETLNKSFVVAGTSQQEMASASLQLTQALGAGALRGDELTSIFEAAPNLIQTITDYMEVDIGKIKEIAGEGKITADIVKNALLGASDSINEQFEKMPMTWAQVWTSITNRLIYASQPLLNMISYIAQNWSAIEPIVLSLAIAVGVYAAALGWHNAVQMVSNFLSTVAAAKSALKAGATLAEAAATKTATGAQVGLNAAILACPVTWIVLAILAIITVIYFWVRSMREAEGKTTSFIGVITGLFMMAGASLLNTFVVPSYNGIAAFVNFLGNAFHNPVAAIQVLFYDLAQVVIGYILNMAEALEALINKIPGMSVDITGGLRSFYNQLESASKKVKDESGWVEYVKKMEFVSYDNAFNQGYQFGEGIGKTINGWFGGNMPEINLGMDTSQINQISENTDDIKNSVSATAEELKFLRDLAETETINRYTTAEIRIDMGGITNHVAQTADIDGVIDRLTEKMEESIMMVAEGVH